MTTAPAPLYVDVVLVGVGVLLAATVLLAVWSVWHGVRTRQTTGRAARTHMRTAGVTALLTAGCLAATFWLGSAEPLATNGTAFADPLWLRTADMFITTSLLLIVTCSALVVAARFRR